MLIGARSAAWGGCEVNYLESHGTEYIDTGLHVGESWTAECDYVHTQISGYRGVFGALGGGNQRFMLYQFNTDTIEWGWNYFWRLGGLDAFTRRTVRIGGKKIFVDGENLMTVTNVLPSGLERSLYVFAFNYNLSNYKPMIGRIWRFRLWNGEELVLNLKPVFANFNGTTEACFYNESYTADGMHGQQFYRNAGAGNFDYG